MPLLSYSVLIAYCETEASGKYYLGKKEAAEGERMATRTRGVTEEECWRMAGLSYRHVLAGRPSERLPGWRTLRLEDGLHDPPSGFDAACFFHAGRKCVVAAFRGTGEAGGFWLSWLADLATDVSGIALPEWLRETFRTEPSDPDGARSPQPDQFDLAGRLARRLVDRYPGFTVMLTGFSLGGALAAYAAAVHGLAAVAFAAPGGFPPPAGPLVPAYSGSAAAPASRAPG